jgi:hypothetical protein
LDKSELKYLALEQDRNLTDLFMEAIEDLLKKHREKKNKDSQQKDLFRNE